MANAYRLYTGVFLLMVAAAGVLAIGCSGGGSEQAAAPTPSAQSSNAQTGSSHTLSLADRTVAFRDAVSVTGEGWHGTSAVTFYLATEQQLDSRDNLYAREKLVLLGETEATDEGSIAFEFEFLPSYETGDGEQLIVEEGLPLFVFARQSKETGSSGFSTGPLTLE